MDPLDLAQETLDAMLGYLGLIATVTSDRTTMSLQVSSNDGPRLIGAHGEGLEEITHLLNRLVLTRCPESPRIHVDIENYLAARDFRLIAEVDEIAARVAATGKPALLEPMNSYQRRLIHTHFKDHPSIHTWSPDDQARLKRVSISLRGDPNPHPPE